MILAVDPGAEHCGWALFKQMPPELVNSGESPPEQFLDRLSGVLRGNALTQLVVEEFRLYPWKAQQQGFSEMGVVEVIGVIKWLARAWKVPVTMQGAAIKKVAKGHLRSEGKALRSVGGHARDAELHGWYFIRRSTWGA